MSARIDGAPPSGAGVAGASDDIDKAARGLEALLLRQLLAEVRKAGAGAGLLDGPGAETFREMLDEAIADKATEGRGIGLRQLFADQLEKVAGESGPRSAAAVEREILKKLPTRPNRVGGGP
jgi:flagellar protein FlgJ